MSTNAEPPYTIEHHEALPPLPPAKIDTLRGMYENRGVRNYLIAGLAALAMIFTILLQNGSDIGGLLLLVLGAAGMVLRWPAAPSFFLVLLLWFLIFPYGLPPAYENRFEVRDSHLRVADVLLAFSVVVYLASHYRVFGFTFQAMPFEQRFPRRGTKPTRRPTDLIRPGEIARLLYLTAGVVVVGQLVWLVATSLEIDVNADFPLKLAEEPPPGKVRRREKFDLLLVLLGLGFFAALFAQLIFGYWRLRLMKAAEGGMAVQDAGWDQTRRELTRVEKWRLWQKAKAKANAEPMPEPGDKR